MARRSNPRESRELVPFYAAFAGATEATQQPFLAGSCLSPQSPSQPAWNTGNDSSPSSLSSTLTNSSGGPSPPWPPSQLSSAGSFVPQGLGTLPEPPPGGRPAPSTIELIKHAILGSPNRRASSREICQAIAKRYEYFQSTDRLRHLRSVTRMHLPCFHLLSCGFLPCSETVRQRLSQTPCFVNTPDRPEEQGGRGGYWEYIETSDPSFRQARQSPSQGSSRRRGSGSTRSRRPSIASGSSLFPQTSQPAVIPDIIPTNRFGPATRQSQSGLLINTHGPPFPFLPPVHRYEELASFVASPDTPALYPMDAATGAVVPPFPPPASPLSQMALASPHAAPRSSLVAPTQTFSMPFPVDNSLSRVLSASRTRQQVDDEALLGKFFDFDLAADAEHDETSSPFSRFS